jgi:hypothetical protein
MNYDYDGIGLTITFDDGRTAYLQGDEGGDLFDVLEACKTDEQVEMILSDYSDVAD